MSFNPGSKANGSCVILSKLLNLSETQFASLSRSSQSMCTVNEVTNALTILFI